MAGPWSSGGANHQRHKALSVFQESLTVGLIATPRAAFVTCGPDESVADVAGRNREERFDHLPVVEPAEGEPRIVGVLATGTWRDGEAPDEPVRRHTPPLGEDVLIGADASILAFIRGADAQPFRFVVAGQRISGLVSLSDLQQIAVRAALFAVMTHLELTMTQAIRHLFSGDDWIPKLTAKRQEVIWDRIESARAQENLVDRLLYTDFRDKVAILGRSWPFGGDGEEKIRFGRDLDNILNLRNRLAHSGDYAATREDAVHVCECVRSMDRWIDTLSSLD